ncbi:MAG: 3-hydroxy-3-methylglutaryl-CoA reductase, partial [Candidatus Micrarchaeota archaeon]|nr:3-hydroxy-3-methylglutaryl-CoA reductase [Candidatus Micrarchaeota archaeon]
AVWKNEKIGKEGIDGVLEAYNFASNDIFRLCTNNKGIMNGIDAVALATGNDWRAIEAGLHTYSMMNKRPLVSYREENGNLIGVFEGPLAAAITGGATKTFNHAKASLSLLNVSSASELAQVMACVGLANNFSALFALSTEGIQKGHMRLHSRNIAIQAGAKSPEEIDYVVSVLIQEGKYDTERAERALGEYRTR